jgi:hypothetical protein
MTMLGLTPCKLPWKQVRSWISLSHDTCHTDQTWQHITSTFLTKLKETPHGHLYDSDEGVEMSVNLDEETNCGVPSWQLWETCPSLANCMENDGAYVENKYRGQEVSFQELYLCFSCWNILINTKVIELEVLCFIHPKYILRCLFFF